MKTEIRPNCDRVVKNDTWTTRLKTVVYQKCDTVVKNVSRIKKG